MDSPSLPSERPRFSNEDDESDNSLASVWNSFKPSHKVLSVLVVSLVLAALVFSSLPLWRPMGALMLHKLWDVLRFLVLTTSIGLGILNSGLWKGTYPPEADSVASRSGKEDSFSSKVPFAGMFCGDGQHSYSFSDKDTEASEYGLMNRSESERDVRPDTDAATSTDRDHDARVKGGHDASAATLTDGHHGNEVSLRPHDDHQSCTQPANSAVSIRRGIQTNNSHRDKEDGAANDEVLVNPSVRMRDNPANVVSRGKNRLVKPYDDLGLAAVAQQPKQSSNSKIIHRRGSSLEFPIVQEGGISVLENCAATNPQRTPQARFRTSEKSASSTDVKVPVHVTRKGTEPSGSSLAAHRVEHSDIDAGVPGAASKHSRSQSAYNLNELLVQEHSRSKPRTSGGQLSKRRNVSLSCDLDREYTNRGMPAWLSSLPSPPEPPFIHGYDIVENRVMSANVAQGKQDESSLRKAFRESLAPWRAVTNTVPVDIPTYTHKEATESNKDPSTKRLENNIPSSSPSTVNTMGSPSPGELNKKVDAYIARFHEQMRLQRLESLERAKQREKGR